MALILFAAALLLRLLFILQSHSQPDFRTPTPGLDICLHWEGARHIRAGTPDPCFELMPPSAPGHPYFVAFCQSFLGENLLIHRLFRALLGSITVALVYLLALRFTQRQWASILAAVFAMTLRSWLYFDTMLIKVSPEICMLAVVLTLATLSIDGWTKGKMLGLGVLLGILLSLMRFSQGGTILYVLALTVYFLAKRASVVWRSRLLIVIPMLLMVFGSQLAFKYREPLFGIPATRFLPVSGVHVRIGFQKGAIGCYHVLRRFPALPLGHTFFSRMAAEAKAGHAMSPAEANQTYIEEARDFIRNNPGETAVILLRKAGIFFNQFEPQGNHYIGDIQRHVGISNLPTVGFGGLMILAFWGAAGLWKSGKRAPFWLLTGLVLAVLISNLAAFVTWRYRLHATLPMAILSAAGVAYLTDRFKAFRSPLTLRKQKVVMSAVFLIVNGFLVWLAFRTVLPNARLMMMTTAERNRELSELAERKLEQVAEMNAQPALTDRAKFERSSLYHALGLYTASYEDVKDIALRDPANIQASRQYLVYLMWDADYDGVVDFLYDLREEDPRAFHQLMGAFRSFSPFWHKSDPNLKLIVQALIRDIVEPRLKKRIVEAERDQLPLRNGTTS